MRRKAGCGLPPRTTIPQVLNPEQVTNTGGEVIGPDPLRPNAGIAGDHPREYPVPPRVPASAASEQPRRLTAGMGGGTDENPKDIRAGAPYRRLASWNSRIDSSPESVGNGLGL